MRILHLEDSEPDAELVAARLAHDCPDCRIQHAASRQQYEAALAHGDFDLILSDYTLHGFDGLTALELARTRCPDKPFIFLSGTIGEERAIEALKRGATDYVIKDRPSRLVPAMQQALARAGEEQQLKRTEEALRQNQERIQRQAELLDRAQDAILMRDMDDRITYWNRSASRIYGWTADEAQGRQASGLWNEDPSQVEVARHATLFYGEWMGEMRQRSRHGVDLIMQSRWSLVHAKDGSAAGFLVINTDIAEKKRLEAQFLRVQRTESIGLLAGGVAHDINNVLVPILAATEMLEPLVEAPEGRQFVATIRSSAQHGAALVRQLLAFARGAVGQQTDLQLEPLMRDFVVFVTQAFPRNVRVELRADPNLWSVRGDATQLKQVLMNLCLNARDAMPEGGRIDIELENVTLSEFDANRLREVKPGPHVVVSVADTGTGMPPNVLERIFDPFFTTKDVGKGTGLGLAAVRGIVKGHNGTIGVESWPGRGTIFRIYLPALVGAPSHAAPVAAEPTAAHGGGRTVLLVDDDDSVRNILSTVLTSGGYRVLKASSATQALGVFEQRGREIELVLTDVMMSDGDGFTLVTRLRNAGAAIPILVMSGMAGAGSYDERAQMLGVTLLAKPLTRDALLTAVQSAFRHATAE